MTVQEVYKIDDDELDKLDELAQESDYWNSSNTFVLQVLDKDFTILSDKQTIWLEKILNEVRRA